MDTAVFDMIRKTFPSPNSSQSHKTFSSSNFHVLMNRFHRGGDLEGRMDCM